MQVRALPVSKTNAAVADRYEPDGGLRVDSAERTRMGHGPIENRQEESLKRISMVALMLAISLPVSAGAESGSKVDCKVLFERIDLDNDQWLRGAEAKEYIHAMTRAGIERVSSDTKLSKSEFMRACEKGTFKN